MIVVGRVTEHLGRQFPSRGHRGISCGLDLLLHHRVVGRIGNHRHRLVVLGGTPKHAGPANIDVFNRQLGRAVGPGHGLLKRIKVHHHQIDRRDLMLRRLFPVGGQIPPLQESAVHLGMKGFDPTIHHFGKSRVVAQLDHLHPRLP